MKQKYKLILDAVLAILLILLMCYSFTGGLLHEILGISLLVGFIVHVGLNHKYYGAAIRALRKKKLSAKNKFAFAINVILPIDAIILLVSSFAISHDLFPGISNAFGGYNAWVTVHVTSAIILFVCVLAHIFMHVKLFARLVKAAAKDPAVLKALHVGSIITAIIMSLLVIKLSTDQVLRAAESVVGNSNILTQAKTAMIASEDSSAGASQNDPNSGQEASGANQQDSGDNSDSSISSAQNGTGLYSDNSIDSEDTDQNSADNSDSSINSGLNSTGIDSVAGSNDFNEDWKAGETDSDDDSDDYYIEPEPEAPAVTLDDYLGSLVCSGCGKHCSLLSPRCGKGQNKAAQATTEYYEIYGE